MQPDDMRERFDSVTFNFQTPEGKANIIIVEDSPSIIYKIFFTIGKAGSLTNAWAHALSEFVVEFLNSGKDMADVIAMLSNVTSSRAVYNREGLVCRSGPEALYLALIQYRNMYKGMQDRKVTIPEDYRPPRFTNR